MKEGISYVTGKQNFYVSYKSIAAIRFFNQHFRKAVFTAWLFLLFTFSAAAATITWNGNTSTDFSLAANWTGGLPGAADAVVVPSNPTGGRFPVLVAGTYTVTSVTVNTGGTLIISGGTLSVSGVISVSGVLTISSGVMKSNGNVAVNAGGVCNQSGGQIYLNQNTSAVPIAHCVVAGTGTFNQTGGIMYVLDLQLSASTSTFNQSGSTTELKIGRDFKNNFGTFMATSGTTEWIGTSTNNVVFNGTTQFHHVVMGPGADPNFDDANNNTFSISGNWVNNSNVVAILNRKITTAIFNGSGDQMIAGSYGTQFHNLIVNKSAGTLTLTIDCTVDKNGSLTISAGTFDLGTHTFNPLAALGSGILSIGSSGTLIVGGSSGGRTGSNFPDLFTHSNMSAGSTVVYNGVSPQTIYGANYSNLILTNGAGAGTSTKTTIANVSVGGQLLVNSGVVLSPSATDVISGAGTLTGTGTVQVTRTDASPEFLAQYSISNRYLLDMTVDYYATLPQFVSPVNYGNLTVSGNRTSNSVTYSPTGTIGIFRVFNPSATFTTGGHIVPGSTIDFNGTSDQNIPAFTFNNLTASGESVKTAIGQIVVDGTVTTRANTTLDMVLFPMNGGVAGVDNKGIVKTANTSTVSLPSGRVWDGVVEYYSSIGGQTVPVGSFATLRINNATGGSTAAGLVTVTTNLQLLSGTFVTGSNTLALQGDVTRGTGIIDPRTGNILFNGISNQNIAAGSFAYPMVNMMVNSSAVVNNASDAEVTNELSLTSGNLVLVSSTLTLGGTITRTSGSIDGTNGGVRFNASFVQSIPANTFEPAVKNLTVDNPTSVVINSNTTVTESFALNMGKFDLNGLKLTLNGTVSGTGVLKGSSTSKLTVASSGTVGTVFFDQTTNESSNALSDFVNSGGTTTLGNKLNLFTVLDVSGGTLDMDGKNVVLKSLPSNTARVAPVTGTMSNYTNVTVERYISDSERRYRLLSPGVTTTGSIRDNWMEGGLNTCFWPASTCNDNPKPGYGTHITGNGHFTNGFDITQTTQNSLFTINPYTGVWVAAQNTFGKLYANVGYFIWIRGDRTVDMTITGDPNTLAGNSTTLRATGTLQVGGQTVTSVVGNGATVLVPNPYASPVSWTSIYNNNSSNFEDYYTYWDSKLGSRGLYVTVTASGLTNNPASTATVEIQGGQAFFVKTKPGVSTPSVQFNEMDKSTTANINPFRSGVHTEKFHMSLSTKGHSGEKINVDAVLVGFGNRYSAAVDGKDAHQIPNLDEDVAIIRDGYALSIETRSLVDEADTVFLSVARLKQQQYEWQFDPSNFITVGMSAYLVDRYTGSTTPITLESGSSVVFEVNSDPASMSSERFYIIFKTTTDLNSSSVMSTLTTELTASKINQSVKLSWKTNTEKKLERYELERAGHNGDFTVIASKLSRGADKSEYNETDPSPSPGINHYRVKAVSKEGDVKYSNVVSVNIGESNMEVSIYPNPVHGSTFNVELKNFRIGKYQVQLVNTSGHLLHEKTIEHEGGLAAHSITVEKPLSPGIYKLIVGKGGQKWSRTIYVQ